MSLTKEDFLTKVKAQSSTKVQHDIDAIIGSFESRHADVSLVDSELAKLKNYQDARAAVELAKTATFEKVNGRMRKTPAIGPSQVQIDALKASISALPAEIKHILGFD